MSGDNAAKSLVVQRVPSTALGMTSGWEFALMCEIFGQIKQPKLIMKNTRTILSVILTLMSFAVSAFSEQAEWNTDYAKAVEQAKEQNKPILLDFTGSDWCGWCIKMKEETLNTPAFATFAKKNLVLVEVDFPRNKPQPEEEKKQNQQLSQKYQVRGYPCFILVSADGRELGRQGGYLQGGPTAFIAMLKTFYKFTTNAPAASARDDFDKLFKKPSPTPNPQ